MTEVRYTVHSAVTTQVPRTVAMDGVKVQAQVPALVVELISRDGVMGHTFSFVGADYGQAALIFTVGASVTATFKKDT